MGTGFDRNTIIGFVLLLGLLFGYIYMAQKGQEGVQKQKQHIADSLARIQAKNLDTIAARLDSARQDTALRLASAGQFTGNVLGTEQTSVLENDLVKITFTNRGGEPLQVELKKFKRFDGAPLLLVKAGEQSFSYLIQTGPGKMAHTSDLYFSAGSVERQGDSQVLRYSLKDSLGHSIIHEYVLAPNQYMTRLNIRVDGAPELLPQSTLNIDWSFTSLPQERDFTYERTNTSLSYLDNNGYDYKTLATPGTGDKNLENLTWIGTQQRFFSNTLISKDNKMGAVVRWTVLPDSMRQLVTTDAAIQIKLTPSGTVNVPLDWYAGPSDYHILKQYGLHMEENVHMGTSIYTFVKYLNRWIVIPVFDFFHSYVANFGIVILLLTFFIRLVISPLTYSSYLSGAKMRVLRPEIDELKKKYKDDQQTFGMEQMKLFRTAGVNPLGGCIPAVLQIPIFFALYSFFASNIALRDQPFLWSHDLSTYDSIYNLPFTIPLYGDHVSLFTLTAIISSFLIQIWNMNMTPDQNNPMMKYMPYIFPVVLLGVFNKLPSGLTWYYTVSNVITLLIQLVIQKFIIDEKKIHAQLQENKKKPKSKSKWQERLESIQETQKKVESVKAKNPKK
jgi:YidC/Oxa1 family membrane protein insertase